MPRWAFGQATSCFRCPMPGREPQRPGRHLIGTLSHIASPRHGRLRPGGHSRELSTPYPQGDQRHDLGHWPRRGRPDPLRRGHRPGRLGTARKSRRASHVEPDADGRWWADLSPVAGPRLGPFEVRSAALDAEPRVAGGASPHRIRRTGRMNCKAQTQTPNPNQRNAHDQGQRQHPQEGPDAWRGVQHAGIRGVNGDRGRRCRRPRRDPRPAPRRVRNHFGRHRRADRPRPGRRRAAAPRGRSAAHAGGKATVRRRQRRRQRPRQWEWRTQPPVQRQTRNGNGHGTER